MFYQYNNVEENFIRQLFLQGRTQLGRVFVDETVLPRNSSLHVLDYQRASHIIRSASHIGIGVCYCRHKMTHVGRACQAPQNICMTFHIVAAALIRNGFAQRVEKFEALDLLRQARSHHLVQFGENVREQVNFICNCCGCCCEAMIVTRNFAFLPPVHPSPFMAQADVGCGKCVRRCPVAAISIPPAKSRHGAAVVDRQRCLGCGVCITACPTANLTLVERPERVLAPLNTAHRSVLMAIERARCRS